jgi:four helix bundle protein
MNKNGSVCGSDARNSVKNIFSRGKDHGFVLLINVFALKSMVRKYDLEDRLINFASECLDISEALPKTLAGNHIAGQLARSSTSPALHYGEAQAAESTNDFAHKMKVCLKELRETHSCLKLIRKKKWYDEKKLNALISENNELISIFVASLKTVARNKRLAEHIKKDAK